MGLCTDLDDTKKAGAVVQRFGGVVRNLCREIDPVKLQNGSQTQNLDGLGVLLKGLEQRCAAQALSTAISSAIDLLTFSRIDGERIDDVLARFELVWRRAEDSGQCQVGPESLLF